jgi:hypothetical protein
MQSQVTLGNRHQNLPTRSNTNAALEVGSAGFQGSALLPQIVEPARRAECRRLA